MAEARATAEAVAAAEVVIIVVATVAATVAVAATTIAVATVVADQPQLITRAISPKFQQHRQPNLQRLQKVNNQTA